MRRRLAATLATFALAAFAVALVVQALPYVFQEGRPASAAEMNANVDALEAAGAAMREDTIAARRIQVTSRERLVHVEVAAFAAAPTGLRFDPRAAARLAPQQDEAIPPFVAGEVVTASRVNAAFDALRSDTENLGEFLRLMVEQDAADIDVRLRAAEAELGVSSPAPIDASLDGVPAIEPSSFQAGGVLDPGDVNAAFAQLDAAQAALATQVDRAEALASDLDARVEALADELGYPDADLVACDAIPNPDFSISRLELSPAAPATLGFDDRVDVTFDFEIDLASLPDAFTYYNVWAMPYYEGRGAVGSRHQASPPITATFGSVGRYFEFDEAEAEEGRVDQVRILIQARAQDTGYGSFGPYLVWCAQEVDYRFE